MFDIKGMRRRAGFTQESAAEALGIPSGTYKAWEYERHAISFEQAVQLADLFDCSLDELAGRNPRAEILPMNEPATRNRVRSAFDAMNHTGREFLADHAERMLKEPYFTVSHNGGRPRTKEMAG